MRYWRIPQRFAQMACVCAQGCPYAEQYGKRCDDGCREDNCDDLGRRFGVGAEDVVDLGFGCVSKGRLGHGERNVWVSGDLEIKGLALVWRRRAK